MTIQELLNKFDTVIYAGLEADESIDDVRTATEIIIDERMTFSGRLEPSRDDAVVALWTLCFIPIPGGPPKTPEHKEKAKRYRRRKVRRIKNDKEKQKKVRADITDRLRLVAPD